jgi:DinB superfamily
MQYTKLDPAQQRATLDSLGSMPAYLTAVLGRLSRDEALIPGPDGMFSPVEQVWHLADLEREGFGTRISRLLSESSPHLPDFDGTAVALARDYRSRSLAEGIAAFAEARRQNIAAIEAIAGAGWQRGGTLEGVGPVSLCDIPAFMSQHDAAHRAEIETWQRSIARDPH